MPGILRHKTLPPDSRTTLVGTACETFTGVMFPLEPDGHTSWGIKARTVLFLSRSGILSLHCERGTAIGIAEFSLFHRAFLQIDALKGAPILPRFHIAERCWRLLEDLKARDLPL